MNRKIYAYWGENDYEKAKKKKEREKKKKEKTSIKMRKRSLFVIVSKKIEINPEVP